MGVQMRHMSQDLKQTKTETRPPKRTKEGEASPVTINKS
jgi:hypothetical protein